MQDLKDKGAFITGGVSGIGLGIAKAFADEGMKVAISYRREDHLAAALAHFEARGQRAQILPLKFDVTDHSAMMQAAADVERAFGKAHVLVNNAGISVFGPADEATYDDYDWIMGVNFGGVVNGLVSFHSSSQGAWRGRPYRQRRLDGVVPSRPPSRHLHRVEIRGARTDRVPARQSRAV
jgi:NAD(P)-dependent dehydrogenase (short-subunit alcohol dehydrogenase family)